MEFNNNNNNNNNNNIFFHIQGTAKSDEMLCINIQYGVDVRKVSTTLLRSAINNANDY